MNCLVTGGAGFIGSHLAAELVRSGHSVTVFDNYSTGKHANLGGLPVFEIDGDLRNPDQVESAVQGMDVVFHLGALCSVARSMSDPKPTHDVNSTGTLNLLEACRKAGVRRMVFSSSSSVYGETDVLPKREQMKPAPISTYALSKLIGEHYCQIYWKTHGLETVCLRYFNVFGPCQDPNSEYAAVIPKFIDAILKGQRPVIYGDGSQTRDFTYVDNVVEANIRAAEMPGLGGDIINVACGSRLSLLELLAGLEYILNVEIQPVFRDARLGDVKHSQASIELAEQLLEYSPRVDFDEGLEKTVEWYRTRTGAAESVATIPSGIKQPVSRTFAAAG